MGKSSVDNLISQRDHQMTASTSAWWRNQPKEERYSTTASVRNLERSNYRSSEIYHHHGKRKALKKCLNSWTALNFTLTLLLLLTIVRQVFDFLGQIWLQILINFFTIIFIIIALFGLKQCRISYLVSFIICALFNTFWNLLVISIHFKIRDINLSEDLLSLNTGAISWWHTNGPGCLPLSITASYPQSVNIKTNTIAGCKFDHHLIESAQAAIHASLSLISLLICFYVAISIYRNPSNFKTNQAKDKSYRLNELTNGRSKINHDPFPVNNTSRFVNDSASLRRPANKISSRSSQRSMSSVRSERRRNRQLVEAGVVPTPRCSVSSTQRSQKYGSLSSRRSSSNRRERRGDVSSLTYATTSAGPPRAGGSGQRTRLSSMSSVDYVLPGYQPPHSSSANLLSSYGEISSIDSYNNPTSSNRASNRNQHRMRDRGNTNPVYNGSRSSVCSQNMNVNNNYDDISNVYGVNNVNGSVYGPSGSVADRAR